jgi:HEAT repeat protein
MFLTPDLTPLGATIYLGEDIPVFFTQLLQGDHDSGIYIDCVRSLQKIDSEGLADVSASATEIRDLLDRSDNRNVRRACAIALVQLGDMASAAAIAKLCLPDDEVLCLKVEPGMAAWQSPEMGAVWLQRIRNADRYSTSLIRLACEGLAESRPQDAEPSVAVMKTLLQDAKQPYAVRYSTADALGRMVPDDAWQIAKEYVAGSLQQRLLAVRLMNQASDAAAIAMLDELCDDRSNAVASQAWQVLADRNPDTLLPRLEKGRSHSEANIRYVAVDLMHRFPSEQHCEWLQDALGDIHIGIRNTARRNLLQLAESQEVLKNGIFGRSGHALADSQANWQELEQSLLLLGQLRHSAFQAECIPLLTHERAEVFVTAAWLLHLMPQQALSQKAAEIAIARRARLKAREFTGAAYQAIDLQIAHLLQAGALTREQTLLELAEEQFDKESGLSEIARSAGMWTIGYLREGVNDARLVKQLFERVFDQDPMLPESTLVQQIAIISVGRMDAEANYDELMRAYRFHGRGSRPNEAARWVLSPLGRDEFPVTEPVRLEAGPWPVTPAVRDRD